MSASMVSFRSECDIDYAVESRGSFEKISKQNHRPSYRRSSSPGSVNGIHRRRGSRWTWGHGRGARMQNVRAFARCVVMAVAGLCAAAAQAGTIAIDMVYVGNPSNSADTNGRGSVGQDFKIGKYEVTNSQYVAFLNAVDPTGSNTLGLYNSAMNTSIRGGITATGTVTGSTYATKSGFASRPVNFVSWMDAARFVNWVQTGTTTETGAYDVAGSTPTARLSTAKYFLPTQDEWYKAAYYNPSLTSYNLYATGTSVNPTSPALTIATLSGTNPATNATVTNPSATTVVYANNGVAVGNTANVGSAGSKSSYDAFDMNGNVFEFTQTAGSSAGQVWMYGGGYGQSLAAMARTNSGNRVSVDYTTYENQGAGFRIAAVPEPSTLVMLAGGASVFAVMCGRRRKSRRDGLRPEAPAQE